MSASFMGLGAGEVALATCVAAPIAGAMLVATVPPTERGLVRLITLLAAAVGLSALAYAVLAPAGVDPATPVRWTSSWRPLVLPGLSGQPGLTLELGGFALPGMLGTFGALIGFGLGVGTRIEDEHPPSAVFTRLSLAAGLALLAFLTTDLLVAAVAWLGVRLSTAFAMRGDVTPKARVRVDDRAVVAFVLGLAVVGVVLLGAMTHYNLSDGIFATDRASLGAVLMPIGTQYVVAGVLALAIFASLGVVPLHRGLTAGFEFAPHSTAASFAIELGVAVHLWWTLGDALAPVAVAELSDTVVFVAIISAAWHALVARVRREGGAALGALASTTVAFALLGLGLGRGQALVGAVMLVLAGQLGIVVFAGTRTASRELATRTGVAVAIGSALALVGLPPSPGYPGLLALTHAGLAETSSQMRWPELACLAAAAVVVVAIVAALRPAIGLGLGEAVARSDDDEDVFGARASARATALALGGMLLAAGLVAGPLHARVVPDAQRLDEGRAKGRCVGVAARDLRHPALREALPVECDDAHRALRRAYGLDPTMSEEGEGTP